MIACVRDKALAVHRRLLTTVGEPVWQWDDDPLSGLVRTILSQHTSDANSCRAFSRLKAAFPRWQAVLAAPDEAIADAIRVGGLANIKAHRIKTCLAGLPRRDDGEPDLSFVTSLDTASARAYLESIPGVGPKTAACVLLFSLGRPALPVDTHVHRQCCRLGLVADDASPEQTEEILEAALPPEAYFGFHVNLVAHGRRVCRGQRPLCQACQLVDLCRSAAARSIPPDGEKLRAASGLQLVQTTAGDEQ